jgi:hypothetical protein
MARIFIDGFESATWDLWDLNMFTHMNEYPGVEVPSEFTSRFCVNQVGLSRAIAPMSEAYFAIKAGTTITLRDPMISLDYNYELFSGEPLGAIFTLWIDSNIGAIHVGGGTNLDGFPEMGQGNPQWRAQSNTGLVNTNTFHLIEAYFKIDGSAGRCIVRFDGIEVINFTGNTLIGAYTTFNVVGLGPTNSNTFMDDFIIDDSEFPGDTRIEAIYSTGEGSTTEWTPSLAPNWDCVDEVPPDDIDYISTNAINKTDTYLMSDLIGPVSSVICVQPQVEIVKEGSPTPLNINLVLRLNSTDYPSADKAVTTVVPNGLSAIWNSNPAGGSWDESTVNNLQVGVKSKT